MIGKHRSDTLSSIERYGRIAVGLLTVIAFALVLLVVKR